MKKLMVAAAIVCAAMCGQAASADWNVEINGFDAGWNFAQGSVLITQAGETLADLTFNEVGTAGGKIEGFVGSTELNPLTIDVKMTTMLAELDAEGATIGYKEYYKTLTFDVPALSGDESKDPGTLTEFNGEISVAFQDPNTGALPDVASAAAQGWTAVPEPTSGLLLLLGVAGLALRRRRA